MKRVVLVMLSLICVPIFANKNFRQKHLPGVTKGPLLPVGMWHIKMDETNKLMDWVLYKQTVNTPEGEKHNHKAIIISQDWGRLNPSKPMDVTVTHSYLKVAPPIHRMTIRLDNVFELVIEEQEDIGEHIEIGKIAWLVGTLYELHKESKKAVGHVTMVGQAKVVPENQ